jgi:hypothetical protein
LRECREQFVFNGVFHARRNDHGPNQCGNVGVSEK